MTNLVWIKALRRVKTIVISDYLLSVVQYPGLQESIIIIYISPSSHQQ